MKHQYLYCLKLYLLVFMRSMLAMNNKSGINLQKAANFVPNLISIIIIISQAFKINYMDSFKTD